MKTLRHCSQDFDQHTKAAIRHIQMVDEWNRCCPPGTDVESRCGSAMARTVGRAVLEKGRACVELEGLPGRSPLELWRPVVKASGSHTVIDVVETVRARYAVCWAGEETVDFKELGALPKIEETV